ncbi:hypothetical protein [Photobacterium minamisatsumaniensis]|uniref:hypothetical protein n=1 Tax=Photobacterium minamisatsumaniensis TaxID=2910233 RepID=UPI003D0C4B5C
MAEAIAQILIIFGNQLAYRVGKLVIIILTIGKLSIEPLPKNYPANFVQVFDDEKVTPVKNAANYSASHTMAIFIGYFVILAAFSTVLYTFRDFFISTKISVSEG